MLELVVFPNPQGSDNRIYNLSPFCAKSEAFMRFSGIEHKVTFFTGNPGTFPKGKLPLIKHDGKIVADSHFIERYLRDTFDIKVSDEKPEMRAIGFFIQKSLEEFLYWAIVYERWMVDKNWERLRNGYFSSIPSLIRPLVTTVIRKNTQKNLKGHGMGRHDKDDVLSLGKETIDQLAQFMANKSFLFGEKVSCFDANIYGFLSNVLYCDLNPVLQGYALQHSHLSEYAKRVANVLDAKN